MSARIGAVLLVLGLAGCTAPPTSPAPSPTPAQLAPSRPAAAVPSPSTLATEPGQWCATNRLGKTFVKDGVTYTCKAPKPYRWLPS